MIAAEAVAKSRPDGRTILVSTPANNYVGPELRKASSATEIFRQRRRHDLPGQTVAVLQPAAAFGLPAIGDERIQEAVDLGLVGAIVAKGQERKSSSFLWPR
jgi:hypothetical protein